MKKLKVFTDESCLNEQYLGYGGIFIREDNYNELELLLEDYAVKNSFSEREFSYKKCSKSDIERYIEFVKLFFDYLIKKKSENKMWVADFRSLIINTETNPIKFLDKSWEEGFYKFYFYFITRSISYIPKDTFTDFELNVADKTDSYKYRTEVLQITTSGALQKNYPTCIVNEIKRDRPKQSRVHQMVDILLGCVTYRFNGKDSDNKRALVEYFEKRIGTSLNKDFKPNIRPINVWGFSSKGQKRWVKDATGIVGF